MGLVGYPLLIVNGASEAFGNGMGIVPFLPGALFELVFRIWLIAKGFDPGGAAAAQTDNTAEPKQPPHPTPVSSS